jgi:hypothetical protein
MGFKASVISRHPRHLIPLLVHAVVRVFHILKNIYTYSKVKEQQILDQIKHIILVVFFIEYVEAGKC